MEAKEQAYLYDLYFAPQWREVFDRLVDEEAKLPALKNAKLLDAECGTGGYAVDLALRAGQQATVVGIDASPDRLALARSKAEIKKAANVSFHPGTLAALGLAADEFDWIVADASMVQTSELPRIVAELRRVAKKDATLVLKLATRGSFDEFFSVLWETLYELDLLTHAAQVEALSAARLTASEAEAQVAAGGWKNVRSVTHKERYDYSNGAEFLRTPLIETSFLADWLAFLPDQATRTRVLQHLPTVIDRARQEMDFDVSLKATLVIAQK